MAWLLSEGVFTWLAFHHRERASNGTETTSVGLTVFSQVLLALPGLVLGVRHLRATDRRYPANPPRIKEIIAVTRTVGPTVHGPASAR